MALEVVVRPVVLPNIRPQAPQSLPPLDDPDKGWCTIQGNPASEVTTSNSFSTSMSKSVNVETERTEDEARVYQMNDDGTVTRENFVDVRVATRIKLRGGAMPIADVTGIDPATQESARKANQLRDDWYIRQVEERNIEIRKRNLKRKN